MHTFSSRVEKFKDSMWSFHLKVPVDIASAYLKDKSSRVMCSIDGQEPFHAGIMSGGKEGKFILLGKDLRKKYRLDDGQKIEVELKEDNSKYGMALPTAMEEMLDQDPIFSDYFHALTAGKQRALIHLVGKMKSVDKRIEKALVICEYLKAAKGNLDFKELNEAFKLGPSL